MCKEVSSFNLRNENILNGLKNIFDQPAWDKNYTSLTTEWTSAIFSYEKNLNLDDPYGFEYYWHCLKQKEHGIALLPKEEEEDSWYGFAFGFGGRSSLVFIKGQQYQDLQQLETELLPTDPNYGGENWIYQQDGSSVHTASRDKKKWFDDDNVEVLPSSAKSLDLNIV